MTGVEYISDAERSFHYCYGNGVCTIMIHEKYYFLSERE